MLVCCAAGGAGGQLGRPKHRLLSQQEVFELMVRDETCTRYLL